MTSRSSKLSVKSGVSASMSSGLQNEEVAKISTDLQVLAQKIAEINGTPVPTPPSACASVANGSSPFVSGLRSIAGSPSSKLEAMEAFVTRLVEFDRLILKKTAPEPSKTPQRRSSRGLDLFTLPTHLHLTDRLLDLYNQSQRVVVVKTHTSNSASGSSSASVADSSFAAESNAAVTALKASVATLTKQLQEAMSKSKSADAEKEKLQKENAKLVKDAAKTVEAIKSAVAAAEEERNQKNNTKSDDIAALAKLQQENAKLSQQLKAAEDAAAAAAAAAKENKSNKPSNESSSSVDPAEFAKLQQENLRLATELGKATLTLDDENNRLAMDLEAATMALGEASTKNNSIDEAQKRVDEMQRMIEHLQQRLEGATAAQDRVVNVIMSRASAIRDGSNDETLLLAPPSAPSSPTKGIAAAGTTPIKKAAVTVAPPSPDVDQQLGQTASSTAASVAENSDLKSLPENMRNAFSLLEAALHKRIAELIAALRLMTSTKELIEGELQSAQLQRDFLHKDFVMLTDEHEALKVAYNSMDYEQRSSKAPQYSGPPSPRGGAAAAVTVASVGSSSSSSRNIDGPGGRLETAEFEHALAIKELQDRLHESYRQAASLTLDVETANGKLSTLERHLHEAIQLNADLQVKLAEADDKRAKAESSMRDLKAERDSYKKLTETLKDKIRQMSVGSGRDAKDFLDTFEEVMRDEMMTMKHAFESKLRTAKEQSEATAKRHLAEIHRIQASTSPLAALSTTGPLLLSSKISGGSSSKSVAGPASSSSSSSSPTKSFKR